MRGKASSKSDKKPQPSSGKESIKRPFVDIRASLSFSKGWTVGKWDNQPTLRAPFGGNEVRFRVKKTRQVRLTLATEATVWVHVFLDGEHVRAIPPESSPASVELATNPADGCDIRIVRTSVSSGPFYVDAHIIDFELDADGLVTPPRVPVPETVFCTFGDSISGNCCVAPEPPFDPYGIGYGWRICEHFGWQYFNTARDGSGLCRRLFDNPLAGERVEKEVIATRPDYLLLFYGTNDLGAGVDPAGEFAPAFDQLMRQLKEGLPACRIACSALLWRHDVAPARIRAYNEIILQTCRNYQIPCADPFDWLSPGDFLDGLHPSREGQQKLAEWFIRFLEETYPDLRSGSSRSAK